MQPPASLAQVLKWLDDQGSTHFGGTSRNLRTAVARFDQCRAKNEPDSAEWVLENLDTLAQRLARTDTELKPASLRVYLSRVRTAIESYLSWTEAPVGWSPRRKMKKLSGRSERAVVSTKMPVPVPEQRTGLAGLTLDDQISLALVAIAEWPLLRPYLMEGLARAMADAKAAES